jgi:hypothetical protein
MVGRNSTFGTEPNFGRGLSSMYKKTNGFMIGSRKGSGYSERGGVSGPREALAAAGEYQKILAKKKANELRILKEQKRALAEKKARTALHDAVKEHKRLRAKLKTAETSPKLGDVAFKERNASRMKLVVVRRRDGRETKLRTGLVE